MHFNLPSLSIAHICAHLLVRPNCTHHFLQIRQRLEVPSACRRLWRWCLSDPIRDCPFRHRYPHPLSGNRFGPVPSDWRRWCFRVDSLPSSRRWSIIRCLFIHAGLLLYNAHRLGDVSCNTCMVLFEYKVVKCMSCAFIFCHNLYHVNPLDSHQSP